MKYLYLPIHLIKFWYPESLAFFIRTFRNLILYLEEDLAVGLMLKLLFVPLFHDSSLAGRVMSFFFRLSRVFVGIAAFAGVSLLIFLGSIYWFLSPFIAAVAFLPIISFEQLMSYLWASILKDTLGFTSAGLLFSGVVLFVHHIVSHPAKKLWKTQNPEEVWQSSWVKRNEISWPNLLKNPKVINLLLYLELQPENLRHLTPTLTQQEVSQHVWDLGKKVGVNYLGPEHFFVATLISLPGIDQELLKFEVKSEDFIDTLDFLNKKARWWRSIMVWDEDFGVKHLKGVNRGWLGVVTPNLDAVSQDLTKQASIKFIPDFVGRAEVVAEVINILSMEQGRNVVIVGEPGSGKTALVEYLAKRIVTGDAPSSLATKRLISLDLTRLLAGVKSQGELAEKVKNVFDDVKASGNIIIFVDEIHNLGVGQVGAEYNLYSMLLPYIEASDFQFLAATEPVNYSRILEKNGSFARLFAKIQLPPASILETINILKDQAISKERYQKIQTSLIAIRTLAELTEQYVKDLVLPDAALKIYDECLVKAENRWIKKRTVESVIQTRTSVPIGEVETKIKTQLLNLENVIHMKMIDQEEAVLAVANTLRRAAAQLREKNRPIGSFLFVGPTGVGKTELSKVLAEVYFSSASEEKSSAHFAGKGNFLRLDMSEYQTADSISRLIGDYSNEGTLTESVHSKPYSLILLDEFEKADPKVLTLFLQVLDDGRLTSGSGRTVDFTNTIVIATSNAASLTIAQGLGQGRTLQEIDPQVRSELLQIFRPELLNRFDEVVLFKPLSPQDLQKVVRLKLASLEKQLKAQGYMVEFSEGLIKKLAQKGYDPVLGARPLRRLLQDTIEAKLSVMILQNQLPKAEKFLIDESLLG